MTAILIVSNNHEFHTDLWQQIRRFIPNAQEDLEKPDIIIVDSNTHQEHNIREKFPNTPIIYLSHNIDAVSDCLNIFLKKPFRLAELLDLIMAANHRLDNSQEGFIFFNDYELHPKQKEIIDLRSNKRLKLTEKEVNIIKYLYKNSDHYISKADLQTNVWQYNEDVATHTIETHIYRLRQKVEALSSRPFITTENGAYKLRQGNKNA